MNNLWTAPFVNYVTAEGEGRGDPRVTSHMLFIFSLVKKLNQKVYSEVEYSSTNFKTSECIIKRFFAFQTNKNGITDSRAD